MGVEKAVHQELNLLLEKEDMKWRQRAKKNWYANRDKNTKFFHICTTQQQKKNFIKHILTAINQRCSKVEDIEKAFFSFFNDLYTSSNPSRPDITKCTEFITPKITEAMNCKLDAAYTKKEMEITLKQMAPLKAPEPDGFGAGFYHKH